MRDEVFGRVQELTSTGALSVALTPGASQQTGTFQISGLDPVIDGERNYVSRFWGHCSTVVDPDAGGSAVNHDQLGKVMASWRLFSQLMGEYFPSNNTRGAPLYHIMQVLGLGYAYPQGARTVIPANTDSDVTIDMFYALCLSQGFLKKPKDTAQPAILWDQGVMEGTLDVSTVLDGDYAGAVIKATTALRAFVETFTSPDNFIGCPFQWRERQIAGGGSQPVLTGVGIESQVPGVAPGCGLAFLAWLTDATGIGMGGPDGVDNFTALEVPWRSQRNVQNLDGLFLSLRAAVGKRVGPSTNGTTAMQDAAGWPFTIATAPVNRPAASSQAMFLPLEFPGADAETSKFPRVAGNLKINFNVTAAITNTHRFTSLEFLEWKDEKVAQLFAAIGINPAHYDFVRKAFNDNAPNEEAVRYTRILARPKTSTTVAAR